VSVAGQEDRVRPAETLTELAAAAGVGALAGVVGTAAMTVSSTVEAKLRGRPYSLTPAKAVEALLGVQATDEQKERRLNEITHWVYGIAWGAARGVLSLAGLSGSAAAAAHLVAVWGSEQVVLPAAGVAEPAWTWHPKEIGIDLLHHVVYVTATGVAFEWLDAHRAVRA
jgi:hypothetical protein